MTEDNGTTPPAEWPLWRRILFRFFFVYLTLQIAPWHWFNGVPGLAYITRPLRQLDRWAVEQANAQLFHTYDKLILPNGSGDTSFAWTEFKLFLVIAGIACVVWSVVDRKRAAYPRLDYWLRTIVRYYVATAALSYGIIKVFALQMIFPTISQMVTPLGDFLPMRLEWMTIGYSDSYQMFAGCAELGAGLLLLFRPSIPLGALAAAGAFANVVLINLGYDVPVKLYSLHLFFCSAYLLAHDAKRLVGFFMLNRGGPPTRAWDPPFSIGRLRYLRWGAKAMLLYFILIMPFVNGYARYKQNRIVVATKPFAVGLYDVQKYVVNGVVVPPFVGDSMRWRDVVIDAATGGSAGTRDTLFWQRYGRGYFRFRADTAKHTVAVWRSSFALDSTWMFSMRYEMPDTATIKFWTKIRNDSVYMELARSNRHFQLAERQFHWLSEYNR